MKPTEVFLNGGVTPLIDTLGRVELEMAAAMIVLACALFDDRWQPVTTPMIGLALKKNIDAGRQPWASLNKNPMCPAPAFYELADKGWARFTQSDRSRSPIELTDKALDEIRKKWWRPTLTPELAPS